MKTLRITLVRAVIETLDLDVEAVHDDADLDEVGRAVYAGVADDDPRWTRDRLAGYRANRHLVADAPADAHPELRVCESAGGDYFVRPVQ